MNNDIWNEKLSAATPATASVASISPVAYATDDNASEDNIGRANLLVKYIHPYFF